MYIIWLDLKLLDLRQRFLCSSIFLKCKHCLWGLIQGPLLFPTFCLNGNAPSVLLLKFFLTKSSLKKVFEANDGELEEVLKSKTREFRELIED
jgi:hypothetical protein